MNILSELKSRFRDSLSKLVDDPAVALDMLRPAQDSKFGDYQANCAMSMGKQLGKPPREIAQLIVDSLNVDDMCEEPEIAGPGFINLKLKTKWLESRLEEARRDERLAIARDSEPRKFVIDYSSPNVAKPMHVGHIRSTVIGDSLARTLRFMGHEVITDNHLGDWGTQFGMIIYGYRHFADQAAYESEPVAELGRIYRCVRRIMDYHNSVASLPKLKKDLGAAQKQLDEALAKPESNDKSANKKIKKAIRKMESQVGDLRKKIEGVNQKIEDAESDEGFIEVARAHANIADLVLEETAKLHAGDADNQALWNEFLPKCRQDIQKIYDRLDVKFDKEHGESFYHDRLPGVVASFEQKGLARESDGAICVFLDGFDAPMIIRKKDGAFLYATSDLATIEYRMKEWNPDVILYVVDFRQGEHFDKLFAAARMWGLNDVELRHIKFGTVMGPDGKPYQTRAGDTVGLEGLLDAAVAKAGKQIDSVANLAKAERDEVADIIGHSAIKYADLSQNRESDYVYNEDNMVAFKGNTAAYIQYSYARTQSIYEKGKVDIDALRESDVPIILEHEKEREIALCLLRFEEAIAEVLVDYEPHHLTSYLFALAGLFAQFFEACPVLKADTEEQKRSRLILCDLVARTIKTGLSLLGIEVVKKM